MMIQRGDRGQREEVVVDVLEGTTTNIEARRDAPYEELIKLFFFFKISKDSEVIDLWSCGCLRLPSDAN